MRQDQEFDWIDDAFDESKQDPLANKGMTGCSSLAVVVAVIGVIVIVAFFALVMPVLGMMSDVLASAGA